MYITTTVFPYMSRDVFVHHCSATSEFVLVRGFLLVSCGRFIASCTGMKWVLGVTVSPAVVLIGDLFIPVGVFG